MPLITGEDLLRATRTSIDKVESLYNESFLPEEIQLFLNKSQLRLLDDLVNKNFQQGILRYEWLRPWQTNVNIPLAWGADQYQLTAVFPANLYYFVAARVSVQVNTSVWNPDGVQKKCLNDIDEANDPALTHTTLEQLSVQETGETLPKENNWFYGENYRNPRGELVGGGIRLHRGRKFLINFISFDYILQPPDIDVSSPGVPTGWSVSANEKIVDYTVEYMRLSIEDPAYQGNVQDFNIRTQNA